MESSVSKIRTQLESNQEYKSRFSNLCVFLNYNINLGKKKAHPNALLPIFTTKSEMTSNQQQSQLDISQILRNSILKQMKSPEERQRELIRLITKNTELFKESFNKHFGKTVNMKVSRLLWISSFWNSLYIEGFKKVDKLLLRIGEFEQEFQGKMKQAGKMLGMGEVSEKEETMVKRILVGYYRISKSNDQYLFNLCLLLVKMHAKSSPLSIEQIGGIFLSLCNLSHHFSSIPSQSHLEKLYKTLQLIDQESCKKIKKFVAKTSINKKQLLQALKQFIKSIGSFYFKSDLARFFLDNILILGKNRMNIYIGFSILLMIIFTDSDEQEMDAQFLERDWEKEKETVMGVILKRSRGIELETFRRVFQVVYEGVNINKLKREEIEDEAQEQSESRVSVEEDYDQPDKPDQPDPNQSENSDQSEKSDQSDKSDQLDQPDKSNKSNKFNKSNKSVKPDKSDKPGKPNKSDFPDKPVKTAICRLLEQQYERKQPIPNLQSLGQTQQSFAFDQSNLTNLSGIVPIIVNSTKI